MKGRGCALAGDTVIGAATGFIPGVKIQGITAGCGSYNSIFKQMTTKTSNGAISLMKAQTAAKILGYCGGDYCRSAL